MSIVIAFLALNILVLVHELGHFTVAKLSKIKVHEFAIFMGPKIFSFVIGETRYSLRLVPIGGYVKLEGEDVASTDENAYNNRPLFIRALVIIAGPMMNIVLAFVIFLIIFTQFGYDTNIVGYIEKDSPAQLEGLKEGDSVISYNGRTVYTESDLMTFLYLDAGEKAVIEYERDGKLKKFTVMPRLFKKERYILGFKPEAWYGSDSNVIKISEDDETGKEIFEDGDRIIKINDTEIRSMDDYISFMDKNKGKEVTVYLERKGNVVEKVIKPKLLEDTIDRYEIGFVLKSVNSGFWVTAKSTFVNTYAVVRYVGYSMYGLFTGKFSPKDMMGPVGLVSTIGEVVEETKDDGIGDFIYSLFKLTAIISIAIGVTNLLPIPPLDGSKIVLIGLEGIRRKPLPQEYEQAIALFGFVLLIILSIFVFFNDIMRIINEKF